MAMKKLFGLLVFLGCLCMTPTHAQVQFGVKDGLTSSKISLDLENFRSGTRMGWFLGPTLKIIHLFSLEPIFPHYTTSVKLRSMTKPSLRRLLRYQSTLV